MSQAKIGGLCNLHLLCEEDPPTPQQPTIVALGVMGEADGECVIGVDGGTSTMICVVSSTSPP